jgi:hypothetical protein
MNNIFMPYNTTETNNNLNGKYSYTSIMDIIPEGYTRVSVDMDKWRNERKIEWRWRFLEIDKKKKVEISYLKYDSDQRVYYNYNGEWVPRTVDPIYDTYVIEQYYYYSDE